MSSYSPRESRRFGLGVHRFTFDDFDAVRLRQVIESRPDVAVVRLPAARLHACTRALGACVSPILADTLVYHAVDRAEQRPVPIVNHDVSYRAATAADRPALAALIDRSFAGYVNHYAANPLFDGDQIRAGFVEWGLGFLDADPNHEVIFVERGSRALGFAACRRSPNQIEIVLNAIDPDAAGRGLYGDLIGHVLNRTDPAAPRVIISTQIHNLRVQRAWAKRGFRIESAQNTIHLNLLLGPGTLPEERRASFADHDELARLTDVIDPSLIGLPVCGTAIWRRGRGVRQIILEDPAGRVAHVRVY